MADLESSTVVGFTKLNSFNYSSWKVNMKVLLMDRGSWEFVGGEEMPLPTDASDRDKRAYAIRKSRAYTTIFQGIEEQFHPLIADTEDGKTAWTILKDNFEPISRARLAGLIDEFFDLRFDPSKDTIGIFCKLVNEKKIQIKDAGFDIPNVLTCFQLIRRLPADYDNIVQTLYRLDDNSFTAANIEKELLVESGRIQQKLKDSGQSIIADAYATSSRKRVLTKSNEEKHSGRVLDRNKLICSYCHKSGHIEEKCFLKKKTTKSKKPISKELSFHNSAEVDSKDFLDTPRSNRRKMDEFLIDTGSTSHFCNQRDWFTNFKSLNPSQVLVGDKNSKSDIFGIGDIHFSVRDRTKLVSIRLENVYFAPNMRRNLISGANMDLAGMHVKWGYNKMIVYSINHKYLFTVPRIGKLYILKGYVKKPTVTNELALSTGLDRELVHRRFCHLNMQMVNHMSQNNIVKGLDNLHGKFDSCDTCRLTKSTRASFKVNHGILTKDVLEKVHLDVWGKSPVSSIGGAEYFLSIIDDFSRYVQVYTIKNKSDVFDCFKLYLAKYERQLNVKLKSVRCDNGMEFCNNKFQSFLSELGIRMEKTSVYSPEQNGVAESYNRVAAEGIRSMLADSGLNSNFWAEALHCFVHVKNRSEHKLLKGKTPFELFYGYKPSVKHFKIFGSLAYVHIPKVQRNKLQPKAKIGIVTGYAVNTKGYRVYLPKERKTIETIHVKIDESKNGAKTLFGKPSTENFSFIDRNSKIDFEDSDENNIRKVEDSEEIKSDDKQNLEVNSKYPNLKPLNIAEWKRVERPRKLSNRIDVYYYPPNNKTRLRSNNQAKKYCEENEIEYDKDKFNFKSLSKTQNVSSNSDTDVETESEDSPSNSFADDQLHDIFEGEVYNVEIPKNFFEAQKLPEKKEWNEAMKKELKIMKDRKVWEIVDKPKDAKVIGNRWVYSVKTDEQNKVKQFKARLVAQGFKQQQGIDFLDVFSPVVNFSVIRLLFIVLVSLLCWDYSQLDVRAAYLYGKLDEVIYMRQPPGFEIKGKTNKVCLLKKSIYGLKQSGRQWNLELDAILKSVGFKKLNFCNCVYKMDNCILLVYVDDMVLFCKTNTILEKTIDLIKSELEIKNLGKVKYLLGVNFENVNGTLFLHQKTYIDRLSKRFSELPKTKVKLPIKVGFKLPNKVNKVIENEIMKKFPYRTLIGCLSFIANRSRPDIAFAVNIMSQFSNCYNYQHWTIVVDLVNYVINTKDDKLCLSNVDNSLLIAYSDANWGCHLTDRFSTSGYLICLAGIPFSWKCSKQKCIALSSMESEFIALTDTTKELLWFANICNELCVIPKIERPTLYCDNQSAIYYCKNNVENLKTKHIDIRFQFVRNLLNEGKFELKFIRSKENLADFLTKSLTKIELDKVKKKLYFVMSDGAAC